MNPKKGLNLNTAGGALGGSSSKGRKALGKGLGALIPNVSSKRDYFECEIERIKPDSEQPRRVWSSPWIRQPSLHWQVIVHAMDT